MSVCLLLLLGWFSFDDGTNKKIGRWDTKNPARVHKDNLLVIADWCGKYDVKLKINTG